MDFQSDPQIHVLPEDVMSIDVSVNNPGDSVLELGSDMTTVVDTSQEAEHMSYLLPNTSVDLDPADLVQQPVFISLTHDQSVVVKTEEGALARSREKAQQDEISSLLGGEECGGSSDEDSTHGLGLVPPASRSKGGGAGAKLLSRPTNSTVQLTHDGQVNIVSRAGSAATSTVSKLTAVRIVEEPQEQQALPLQDLQHIILSDGTLAYLNIATQQAVTSTAGIHLNIATPMETTSEIVNPETQLEDPDLSKSVPTIIQLDDGSIAYLTAAGAIEESVPQQQLSITAPETPHANLELEQEKAEVKEDNAQEELVQIGNMSDILVTQQPTAMKSTTGSASVSALLGDKTYQCTKSSCLKFFSTLHHLKMHERTHTGDRPFVCGFSGCDKAFATAYGLKSHTRVHTGEKPYKCPIEECSKAFKTSGDLQKHLRTHTGDRPFKCPFEGCGKSFTTSNIRKVHIRTHTGERPYLCPMADCGKSFSSATNYKNHVRIHTGERPYVCPLKGCGKRFTEYSSLYKHQIVHTHSKPYVCQICGKTYRQTSTLTTHRKTAHGDDSTLLDIEPALSKPVNPSSLNTDDQDEDALVINTGENSSPAKVVMTSTSAAEADDSEELQAMSSSKPRGTRTARQQQRTITMSSSMLKSLVNASDTMLGAGDAATPSSKASNKRQKQSNSEDNIVTKKGLVLPPELRGQRVFVITDPEQIQMLQNLSQPKQTVQLLTQSESDSTNTTASRGSKTARYTTK